MRVRNPNSTVSDCGFCSVTGEHFERPDRLLSGQKQPAVARDPRAWQCLFDTIECAMANAATCCCELKVMRGFRITSLIQHRQSGSAVTTLSVVSKYFSTSTSWLKATCSQATCARSRSSPRTTSVDPSARYPGSRGRQRVRHLQAQSTRKVPLMLARVLAPGPRPLPARPVNRHQVHGLVPRRGARLIAIHPRSLDQYSQGRFPRIHRGWLRPLESRTVAALSYGFAPYNQKRLTMPTLTPPGRI
jgi:hypothetical protein